MQTFVSIPPRSLASALAFVKTGGRLCVRTSTRVTTIDQKTVMRFEQAKAWLLKEEGETYRLRSGNSSVYLFAGQLEAIDPGAFQFGPSGQACVATS